MNIPFNGLVYVQLQIIPLHSQEHEANDSTRKCVGSLFNKLSTPLATLVHSFGTAISVVRASLVTNSHSPNVRTVEIPQDRPGNFP
jgi:hypothetical protein